MTLHSIANFPNSRCYVLKLHRDAVPALGRLLGRVEHIATGDHVDFDSGAELIAWLNLHGAKVDEAAAAGDAA
ncbi:MAG: hypothetical protein QM722_05170 [Piscinibacter sp.]